MFSVTVSGDRPEPFRPTSSTPSANPAKASGEAVPEVANSIAELSVMARMGSGVRSYPADVVTLPADPAP